MVREIASIRIGNEYFKNQSRAEYGQRLEFVWFREAIQNSSDARAKTIAINIDEEARTVSLTDDGTGMDDDIIFNRLLTLGGSYKEGSTVGGFGKAKEILFLTWDHWSIDTSRDANTLYHVDSTMINREPIRIIPNGTQHRGTKITIKVDDSMDLLNWERYAEYYIGLCYSPIRFMLNGHEVSTLQNRGKAFTSDWADIRVRKSDSPCIAVIRSKGLPQYVQYIRYKAIITVDLKGDSTQMMNSSREALTYEYRTKLDDLINEFNLNPRTAMRKGMETKIMHYTGSDLKVTIQKEIESIEAVPQTELEVAAEMIEAAIETCTANGITDYRQVSEEIRKSENISRVSEPVFTRITQVIENNAYAMGPMGYKFIVKRTGMQPNIKITGQRAQTILHMWTKIILKLAKMHGMNDTIGVGLLYQKTVDDGLESIKNPEASCYTFEGKSHFLINPNVITSTANSLQLGLRLFPLACHEVAHYFESDHNEEFTCVEGKFLSYLHQDVQGWFETFRNAKKDIKNVMG